MQKTADPIRKIKVMITSNHIPISIFLCVYCVQQSRVTEYTKKKQGNIPTKKRKDV